MIELIAKKNVLLKQERSSGKTKDILTKKGEKIKVNEEDAIRCWGAFDFNETQQKTLLAYAKKEKLKRVI